MYPHRARRLYPQAADFVDAARSVPGSRLNKPKVGWKGVTSMRNWLKRDSGMVSAEYAIGILAAVAFAMLLLAVINSDAVRAALTSIVQGALST